MCAVKDFTSQAIEQTKRFLQETTGEKGEVMSPSEDVICDLALKTGPHLFLVQAKQPSSASPVYMAAKELRNAASVFSKTKRNLPAIVVPLLVVPYMGEVGRHICDEEGIAWLDLSGNASIRAPGLRVLISGQKNGFRRRGRQTAPFTPQASRLARQFLIGHKDRYTQKELVESTELDQGFVSRVLRRMVQENLIKRLDRLYEVASRSLLLQAWQEVYDFTKHRVIQGHVATRSSEDLLRSLSKTFCNERVRFAATGLAGAWLLTHNASFRLVTIYVGDEPSNQLLTTLGFREGEKGANTWLVVPNDEGVFSGSQSHDGLPCVHPVQVYLDLKFHPERSSEAADRLKERYLAYDEEE
jgi:hypothetical protein